MNLILVPGFWLGAWSWDKVTPVLKAAGHHVFPVTRPGEDSPQPNSGFAHSAHAQKKPGMMRETD